MSFSSDQPLVSNQASDFDLPDNYEDFSDIFDREYKKIIDIINTKEGAIYLPQESSTFQIYFDDENPMVTKNVYRKLILFGALPDTTTKRVPHNISLTNVARLTRLYGAATSTSALSYLPLPFSSPTLADNISLEADERDIIITTGADYSTYSEVTIVMEYSKGV